MIKVRIVEEITAPNTENASSIFYIEEYKKTFFGLGKEKWKIIQQNDWGLGYVDVYYYTKEEAQAYIDRTFIPLQVVIHEEQSFDNV